MGVGVAVDIGTTRSVITVVGRTGVEAQEITCETISPFVRVTVITPALHPTGNCACATAGNKNPKTKRHPPTNKIIFFTSVLLAFRHFVSTPKLAGRKRKTID